MAETQRKPSIDTGWSFPTRAIESLKKMWGEKKESEPAKPDTFSEFNQLQNTDKKALIRIYEYLKKKDQDEGTANSPHIIDVLKEEIARKEISNDHLREFAILLVEELNQRHHDKKTKKTGTQIDIDRQKDYRIQVLSNRVENVLRRYYESKRIFSHLTAEEEKASEPGAIEDHSKKIAEKIVNAPNKFDESLSMFIDTLQADLTKKEVEYFAKKRTSLTPEDIKKIFELHPNDYEEQATEYELVFARANILSATGMDEEAKIVKDLNLRYSPVDGAKLQSPSDRLKYLEILQNPNDPKMKWRKEKKSYYDKEWSREFIANEIIPDQLAKNAKFGDVVKQIHWFQVAGSNDQRESARMLDRDIAGEYRQEHVSIGNYPAPKYTDIETMMLKFEAQIDAFSAQIERLRTTEPPDVFEQKVHQFACYVSSQFTAIHPMVDGNGRTSRSLREYIIAKHLGVEKIPAYAGTNAEGKDYYNLLNCLRYGPVTITEDRLNSYYNSDLETKFRTTTSREEQIRLGLHHEPLMAHLEQTDIQKEVFDNKAIVDFANRAKEIIDSK